MHRGDPHTARGRLLGVGLLLTALVTAATLAGPWSPPLSRDTTWRWTPFPPDATAPVPVRRPAAPRVVRDLVDPAVLTLVARIGLGLLGLLLLLGVALLVPPLRRLLLELLGRRPRRADPHGADVTGLATAAGAGQPDLSALGRGVADAGHAMDGGHAEPADAVIAAWVELERAAGGCGVDRDPASTATEFTVAVLDSTPADRDATRTLLGLYLRARFATGAVTPSDVGSARAALARLEAGLGASVGRAATGGHP